MCITLDNAICIRNYYRKSIMMQFDHSICDKSISVWINETMYSKKRLVSVWVGFIFSILALSFLRWSFHIPNGATCDFSASNPPFTCHLRRITLSTSYSHYIYTWLFLHTILYVCMCLCVCVMMMLCRSMMITMSSLTTILVNFFSLIMCASH